jgi:hypothetical protein
LGAGGLVLTLIGIAGSISAITSELDISVIDVPLLKPIIVGADGVPGIGETAGFMAKANRRCRQRFSTGEENSQTYKETGEY